MIEQPKQRSLLVIRWGYFCFADNILLFPTKGFISNIASLKNYSRTQVKDHRNSSLTNILMKSGKPQTHKLHLLWVFDHNLFLSLSMVLRTRRENCRWKVKLMSNHKTFTGHVTAKSAECVLTLAFGAFQNFPVLPCTKPNPRLFITPSLDYLTWPRYRNFKFTAGGGN